MYAKESEGERGIRGKRKVKGEMGQSSTMDQMMMLKRVHYIPRHSTDASRKYLLSDCKVCKRCRPLLLIQEHIEADTMSPFCSSSVLMERL